LNGLEEQNIDAYILNVFTGEEAMGNPAAVIKLNTWLPAKELERLSQHLGQPVTSFIVDVEQGYEIRWFAGEVEINLCGHGSLAAAAAIYEITPNHASEITFVSKHGIIAVNKQANGYTMTMPSWEPEHSPDLYKYAKLLGVDPIDVFSTRDLVIVLESEEQVHRFQPDIDAIESISEYHATIVTAQKGTSDYVLRYFAPSIGIDEDIATGSAQCSLAPYWSKQLSSTVLEATQLSAQGGYFKVSKNNCGGIELMVNVVLKQVVNIS